MADNNPNMLTPKDVVESNIKVEENRVKMPMVRLILLAILAGAFIALGAEASSTAMHAISNVGLARLVAGCVFPIGLMMIVMIGGELFTGDCLLILGILDRKYKIMGAIRVLITVWIANLVGAVIIALLTYYSGQWGYSGDLLGAFTIKVAIGKCNLDFGTAFSSGILCNIFVCGAVLMATAAKNITGKIWACFFPIMAFVVSGFEHCVANMYYIPAGYIAAQNSAYVEKAKEVYGFTQEQIDSINCKNFFVDSSIPVTLGNIVGGAVCLGAILFYIYKRKSENQ